MSGLKKIIDKINRHWGVPIECFIIYNDNIKEKIRFNRKKKLERIFNEKT